MSIWQRLRGVEKRQEGGAYSAAILSMIRAQSDGAAVSAGATAAVEAASGFVARGFASADITTADSRMAGVLDPLTLSTIGRSLIRSGEYVAAIRMDIEDERPRLAPAASYSIIGGENPKSWVYRISLAGPGRQTELSDLPATGVVHILYSADTQPFRGVGPIQAAHLSGRLSAEVSCALGDELSGPRGQLLPLPNLDGEDPAIDALKNDVRSLRGGLAFVESMADSFGTGPQAGNPTSGWDSRRIGAKIDAGSVEVARMAFAEVLAACGLSADLWLDSTGTGRRESYRQALHSLLAPLGRIAAAQLSIKLGTEVKMDWAELRAGDITGRARSMKAMVESGVDLADAMSLSGLMIGDD